MSGPHPDLTRMVLALLHGGQDGARMDAIGALAELLNLEVHGLFLEDPGLRALAGHPFARELRTLGPSWIPVEATRLAAELEDAAETLRRRLFDIFGRRRLRTHFEVAREGAVAAIEHLRPGDILVLVEPNDPAELALRRFSELTEAAFAAAAAVLIVPAPLVRTRGPVVAIAADAGDSTVELALTIAAAARERLIVLRPPGREAQRAESGAGTARSVMPAAVEEIPLKVTRVGPADIASRLAGVNERLIVASRAALDRAIGTAAASLLKVPILLTGHSSE